MNLKTMEIKELLKLQASITNELKGREVVRTKNNILGDYTEWLVGKALGLELQTNSKAGYDGLTENGIRVQIKGRRITTESKSRQLSAIRKLDRNDFDVLAVVIFGEDFEIIDAVLIPHKVVGEYASYSEHVNAHILILSGPILCDPRVKCIKKSIHLSDCSKCLEDSAQSELHA